MKASQKGEVEGESLFFIAPRRPWKPRTSGMYQEPIQSFPQYHNQVPTQNIPNTNMPWQSWATPRTQNQPFKQGWRGFVGGNQYAPKQFYRPSYHQQSFNYPYSYQNHSPYQQSYPQQEQQQFNPYPQYSYSSPQPPQSAQSRQLQFPPNQPPPKPTQLPSHPVANPNNKVEKQVYQTRGKNFTNLFNFFCT